MSMAYIREFYKVPAKRGGRVLINGWAGTITGSDGQYIKVRFDGSCIVRRWHPTWRVTYYTTPNKVCTRQVGQRARLKVKIQLHHAGKANR